MTPPPVRVTASAIAHHTAWARFVCYPSLLSHFLGGRLATRPMLRVLAELPRATCASLLEFDAARQVDVGRHVLDDQLNHPARRIWLLGASAFLTCGQASALQRVCSITRKTRLMRSQGCQRRASVKETGPSSSSP